MPIYITLFKVFKLNWADRFNNFFMATNNIYIEFIPCEPTPVNGFKISYRPVGGGGYRVAPANFYTSPAVIVDNSDPVGTSYEGFMQGDCGPGKLGIMIPFIAHNNDSSGSGSESGSQSGSASGSESESESVPAFIGLDVGASNALESICASFGINVWLLAPNTSLATGLTVYSSPNLLDLYTGKEYIKDSGGIVYNLDPVTAVVGSPTGDAC